MYITCLIYATSSRLFIGVFTCRVTVLFIVMYRVIFKCNVDIEYQRVVYMQITNILENVPRQTIEYHLNLNISGHYVCLYNVIFHGHQRKIIQESVANDSSICYLQFEDVCFPTTISNLCTHICKFSELDIDALDM